MRGDMNDPEEEPRVDPPLERFTEGVKRYRQQIIDGKALAEAAVAGGLRLAGGPGSEETAHLREMHRLPRKQTITVTDSNENVPHYGTAKRVAVAPLPTATGGKRAKTVVAVPVAKKVAVPVAKKVVAAKKVKKAKK